MISNEERILMHNNISIDVAWSLLSISENMATYSFRLSKQRFFTNGLLALG